MDNEKQISNKMRASFLVVLLVTLLVLGVLSVLLSDYLAKRAQQNRERIYGEWVEQNVPNFARDRFVVSKEGIYVEQRIVDTDYRFDGSELSYHYQGEDFIYRIKDEEMTLLERIEPLHYRSVFKLSHDGQQQAEQPDYDVDSSGRK